MDCSCTIDVDMDGDGPSCCTTAIRKARKHHKCCECYRQIEVGESYEYVSGIWDGVPHIYKTCADCLSIKNVFFTSYYFRELWSMLEEQYNFEYDRIPESCLSKLTSTARSRICNLVEEQWEDEEDE